MITQILEAFRDLIIGLLPKSLIPRFVKGEFAFLCHPLDERDASRKYPFTKGISQRLFEIWTTHFWPVLGAPILGPTKVDGHESQGWAVIQPLAPPIMVKDPDAARKMIIRGVKLCEKLGFRLVALGGYNSIITRDGEDLIGKVNIAITTGNSYSALLVIQNLKRLSELLKIDLRNEKVALIGAAGSVGTACSELLPTFVREVWLLDSNRKALRELVERLQQKFSNVRSFEDMNIIKEFDVVITATSTPRAIVHDEHLKPGLILIDAAQPKNVSEEIARKRDDVLVIDSGIAELPRLACEMEMGPYENEVYACLGEALALSCLNRFESFSIGKVKVDQVNDLSQIVERLGFKVAKFRNAAGFIENDYLEKFKEYRLKHLSAIKK